jgi:hypothetical protein
VAIDSSSQEIYIAASQISPSGATDVLAPLGFTNKSLGGGSFTDSNGNGQVGVSGGTGLNNIGLLVRTTGIASNGDANGFTLSDGSGVTLQVSLAGSGSAYDGDYVTVTGISCIGSGGIRVIKAFGNGGGGATGAVTVVYQPPSSVSYSSSEIKASVFIRPIQVGQNPKKALFIIMNDSNTAQTVTLTPNWANLGVAQPTQLVDAFAAQEIPPSNVTVPVVGGSATFTVGAYNYRALSTQ